MSEAKAVGVCISLYDLLDPHTALPILLFAQKPREQFVLEILLQGVFKV